jgi:DMSO/TMAO reductase YedYZ heme-binding membrane subunit
MTGGNPQPTAELTGLTRQVWRKLAGLFVAGVLIVPFALINRDFALMRQDMDGTFHGLLRFFALMGISLLFLQIVSGAFRPLLRRAFTPSGLHQFHKGFGLAGFACIGLHFLFLIHSIGEHWDALNHGFFVLGPIMLFVLAVSTVTAILMARLPSGVWRRLHLLNYLVFAVGAIHALGIGTQTAMLSTRLVFAFYLAVAAAGLAYRISSAERRPAW